jgi:hypothetical protein
MTFTFKLAARLARLWSAMIFLFTTIAIGCLPEKGGANDPTPTDSTVISITVDPEQAAVDSAQPVSFAAYGRFAAGDSIPVTVTWSASGGTITSAGQFRADSAGDYAIVARFEGGSLRDSARVSVRAPRPRLASVVVTPATAALDTGETAIFSAYALDTAGDSFAVAVSWTASGGTISAAGAFRSSNPGNYLIIGRAPGGKSDTALVTVTASSPPPPPPNGLVNECSAPGAGWIFCDDFDQDRLGAYFEYDAKNGSFVRASGVGNGGSPAMKARFAVGQVDAGSLHLAFGKTPQAIFRPADAGTANYREIYWRFYIKYQAGWTGGGGNKVSRAFGFASTTSWAQSMFGHVWSGGGGNINYLVLDPASGTDAAGNLVTTAYNDFPNMRWLGAVRSSTPIFDAAHVGSWYCIEAHVRLNAAGQSDGVFDLWINGNPEASRTGLNWVGSFNAYGINAVYLENYWNNGSPAAQERYFDNLVVSTQRIGC